MTSGLRNAIFAEIGQMFGGTMATKNGISGLGGLVLPILALLSGCSSGTESVPPPVPPLPPLVVAIQPSLPTGDIRVLIGDSVQLKVAVNIPDSIRPTWSVKDTVVARITPDGLLTALTSGTSMVRVDFTYDGGKSGGAGVAPLEVVAR